MKENKSKSSNVPRKSARSAWIYACATLYASPYLVITPQGYTKHYYAEAECNPTR